MPIEKIVILPNRGRKNFGDIEVLKDSIAKLGLLQPVVVNSRNELVAGERRLRAVKELGFEEVDVREISTLGELENALLAEHDENVCRKDFTPSEKVALAERYRTFVEELNSKRRSKNQGRPDTGKGYSKKKKGEEEAEPVEIVDPDSSQPVNESASDEPVIVDENDPRFQGRSVDILARFVNMSAENYRRARKIVDAAKEDPEKFQDIVDRMDADDNINKAWNMYLDRTKPPEPVVTGNGEKKEIRDANGTMVPKRLQDKFDDATMKSTLDFVDSVQKELKQILSACKGMAEWNPYLLFAKLPGSKESGVKELINSMRKNAEVLEAMIENSKPHVLCKYCSGRGCARCKKSGFTPKVVVVDSGEGSEE